MAIRLQKVEKVHGDRGLVNAAATVAKTLSEEQVEDIHGRQKLDGYYIFSDDKVIIAYNKRDHEVMVSLAGAPAGEYVLYYALGRVLQFVPGDWVDHLVDKLLPQVDI